MEPYLKLVKFGTMMQFSKIFRPVTYPAEYFHRSSTTSFILNILLISLPEGEAEEKQLVYIRILNTNENCLLPLPRSSFMAFLVSFVLKWKKTNLFLCHLVSFGVQTFHHYIQSCIMSIFYTDHFCPTKFTQIYLSMTDSVISVTLCNSDYIITGTRIEDVTTPYPVVGSTVSMNCSVRVSKDHYR